MAGKENAPVIPEGSQMDQRKRTSAKGCTVLLETSLLSHEYSENKATLSSKMARSLPKS